MLRSLYSGVSGLQNHQTRMDVVGNNIANVNTIGFKKGRVNFKDMISQTQSGPSKPEESVGGVNPKQVGLGMKVGAIDTIHTQGSLQSTGIKTDLAIQGNGFFILKNGEESFYTRAGAFSIDADGVLVDPSNGLRVQGWVANTDGNINLSSQIGQLKIPVGEKIVAKATTRMDVRCNLDKNMPVIQDPTNAKEVEKGTWKASYDLVDSLGGKHQITVEYTKLSQDPNGDGNLVEIPNQWNVRVRVKDLKTNNFLNINTNIGGTAANNVANGTSTLSTDGVDRYSDFTMTFDNNGKIASLRVPGAADGAAGVVNTDELSSQITIDVPRTSPNADGTPYQQTFDFILGTAGSTRDSSTQSTSSSTNKFFAQDGYQLGYLTDFNIDRSGIITGIYNNGVKKGLGRIALASFINPGGLQKNGDTLFSETGNSGSVNVGPSNTEGKGVFTPGTLEMSNVDLSEMFTDMIVTQRGFQANSRTIQTSDQILQELLSLKR